MSIMGDNKQQSERGMVSILVTMIMMVVISLIIIGISQVTRSNRREQLDQQLSTQAYYAAESGVNQAARFFAANPAAKLNTNGNCSQFITAASPNGLQQVLGVGNVLSSSTNVSYTCLMVNSTPTNLQKAPLTQDSNTVWRLQDSAGLAFTQLEFKWAPNNATQFTGANNTCSAANFTMWGNWKCAFGILRVDIIPTQGTVSNATLESSTAPKMIYMVPTFTVSGVTTPQNMPTNVGVINVKCTATLCDLKITPTVASTEYFVRLSMLYQDADSVQVSGTDTGGVAKFSGGQAVVDVTGRAQDQLRRIQARIPLVIGSSPMPTFALMSTDTICKQLAVGSGLTTVDSCP